MQTLLVFLFFSSLSQAEDYISSVADGAIEEIHDHHCYCRKVSNSSGKAIMLPWRTSAEWSAFAAASVAGVVIDSCIPIAPGNPIFMGFPDISDTAFNACAITTATRTINGITNSAGYSLRVVIPAAYFTSPTCTATAHVKNGGVTTDTNLAAGTTLVTLCQNSELSFSFACDSSLNHGPYTVSLNASNGLTNLDSFDVSFDFWASGCKSGAKQ